ncbi:MAG: AraC family transcriptional regulator [Chloroflexi bacterium]|nr:AraC family transcriptional regulator [Chloroflexota bacterium]
MPGTNTETIVQFIRDPELRHIELRYSEYTEPVFHRHNHDAFSIGLVKKGQTRFHLVQKEEMVLPVTTGNVVLINPGEVHACNPETGTVFAYYMLYIEPDFFLRLLSDYTGNPITGYRFPVSLLKKHEISREVNALCHAIQSRQAGLEIETRLLETLADILEACSSYSISNHPDGEISSSVAAAYDHLREHPEKAISLKELAGLCHLSPFHFLRLFRRQYGLPPHTAQTQMRVNMARRLLANGATIAGAAAAAGFADQSHFTREFKKSVGTTPQKYRQAA